MLDNQKKPLISVIVPVYNTEKYLHRCLNSILQQSYDHLEIILVNDGSLDNSPNICDAYANQDSRVKVIHKPNGGLSDARNMGIKHANGEYLSFIDSDDYIDVGLYERFVEKLNDCKDNIDIYIFNVNKETKQGWVVGTTVHEAVYEKSKQKVLENTFVLRGVDAYACNKIYKKDLFLNISFPLGKLYEDIFTIPKLIHFSHNSICIDNFLGYFYCLNESSIVNAKFSERQFDNITERVLLKEFIDKNYPDLSDLALNKVVDGFLSTGYKLSSSQKNEVYHKSRKNIKNMVIENFSKIIVNNQISFLKKMALLLFFVNNDVYRFCYKKYLRK